MRINDPHPISLCCIFDKVLKQSLVFNSFLILTTNVDTIKTFSLPFTFPWSCEIKNCFFDHRRIFKHTFGYMIYYHYVFLENKISSLICFGRKFHLCLYFLLLFFGPALQHSRCDCVIIIILQWKSMAGPCSIPGYSKWPFLKPGESRGGMKRRDCPMLVGMVTLPGEKEPGRRGGALSHGSSL